MILKSIGKLIFKPLYNKFKWIDSKIDNNLNLLLRVLNYREYSATHQRKKVIYTCITGNYDNLIQHNYIDYDYDYVCFTDSADLLRIGSFGVWTIKQLEYSEYDNTRNNRWHKMHPHILFPDYEESIYVDGNIDIQTDLLFNLIDKKDIIKIPIHAGDCIYDECHNITKKRKDTKENVKKIIDFLQKENFPKHYGLNENCIIYRKHNNKKIVAIMEMWWNFISNYSKRDQLSLSYILWKFDIKPCDIAFPNVRNDDCFIFHGKH